MKFSLLFVLIQLCAIALSFGEGVNPVFDEFAFENGLSSNEIRCLAQDGDGFIWIGTTEGLNRYDGNSFVQYFKSDSGLAANNINDVICLGNNRIAIATVSGLNFFDTHRNTFSVFRSKDTTSLADFSNNFQNLCVDKAKNLWAYTQTDLYVFDSSLHLLRTFLSGFTAQDVNRKRFAFVWSVTSLPDGDVLVLFSDHFSIYKTSGGKISESSSIVSSPWQFVTAGDFSRIYLNDTYGRFWFFKTGKDSVYQFNPAKQSFKAFPLFRGASNYFTYATNIFCSDSNHIIMLLPRVGFYELSFTQNHSEISFLNHLPASESPVCFLSDRENDFWIGTISALYQYSPLKNQFSFVSLTGSAGSDADVNFIKRQNGDLWLCSYGNGFYRFNLSSETYTHYAPHSSRVYFSSLVWRISRISADTMWVGTQNGLIWFATKTQSFGKLSAPHPAILDSFPITTQFEDSHGILWMGIGIGHGVVAYDLKKKSFTVYDGKSSPAFPLRHPTAITEDENDNLWMGTQGGGGLVKWNRTSNKFTLLRAKSELVFSDSRINDLYADGKGHIWIGTLFNGLLCYDLATEKFSSFGKNNGLSQESIFRIEAAQYPYLWVTTSFGLDRFNIETKMFEAFFKKDGLPADDLSEAVYYDDSTGIMYIGYRYGFVKFNAREFSTNQALPNVIINSLLVNNQPLNKDLGENIALNYRQNNLTVNFTAIDFVNGAALKFRYRLSDEETWNDAGKNREIHFSNLSPGSYSLFIEGANKSGTWNEKSTALHFTITPPFWKTGWFYFLLVAIVAAIIYSLYRFRIRQLQHVQEMRNRIAQDLHDDIGGTMTAMNLTNELAMQHLHDTPVAQKLLTSISEDLKNVGETLDDIVWTVNPGNDSMLEVMARMRRYASRTWEAAGIDFSFAFEADAEKIRLNMEQRHDLYLVFKEAVNNVAKHAQCSQASSSLHLKNHSLIIEVKDNGKGFDADAPTHRNGIKNMQSRMKKWKAEFQIQSAPDRGTTIHLRMPITQKSD